jgi:hypothetical protein
MMTMNLAEVIHQRWAAAGTLESLLPAERVHTGLGVDAGLPYAVISKRADRPLSRHNDGSAVAEVVLQIEVFHDDYDAAAAIMHEIKTAFDRTAFDLAAGDKVLDMRRANDRETQSDDGLWQLTIDFNCTIHLPTGV